MISPKLKWFLLALCIVTLAGCSSTDTSEEDEVMSIEDTGSGGEVGSLEDELDAADSGGGDDFGGEDVADSGGDDFGGDDFGDDDFGGDDFADDSGGGDDFADGSGGGDDLDQAFEDSLEDENQLEPMSDDPFAEENLAQEPVEEPLQETPLEEQLAEEPAFEEPLDPAPMEEAGGPGIIEASGPAADITNIKFLANQNGGTVVIDGSGPLQHSTRVNEETNQFVVEVQNATLPDRLTRPFILKEFPDASFGAINAYQDPGSSTVRVVIQMKSAGFAEPVVQPEGNSLIVIPSGLGEQMPVAEEETVPVEEEMVAAEAAVEEGLEEAEVEEIPGAGSVEEEQESFDVASANADTEALGSKTLNEFLTGNNKFYGRPISIQVKDADIRDVLSFIAGESGTNMIIADQVKGNITLKLREIPWDQALVTVMKAKNLGYIREGSVIRINTLQELENEARNARRIVEAQKNIEPLKVKVIPVSFADVGELSGNIQPFLTPGRGSIVADNRTSSLIITDTAETLRKAERLVKELDVAPAQVMIEGKIVEAVETFNRTLGINWSASGSTVELADKGGLDNGPINLSSSLGVSNLDDTIITPFNMDVQVGTLEFFGDLTAQLRLAESDELVNVISSPRVVTMNRQRASIKQDSEVVDISSTIEEGTVTTSVKRTPVVVELDVLPQVTADGSVIMEINVKREFAGAIVEQTTLARPIRKREAQTRVLVKNGATAVIGGMFNSSEGKAERGVPLLKNIPVIGWLFKSRTRDTEKNELLIFLTPRILNLQDQSVPDQVDTEV